MELDEFDLDTVSFEDLLKDANTVSVIPEPEAPEPLPFDCNPEDLEEFTVDELACLFDEPVDSYQSVINVINVFIHHSF
jgi:hypothetical protein